MEELQPYTFIAWMHILPTVAQTRQQGRMPIGLSMKASQTAYNLRQ